MYRFILKTQNRQKCSTLKSRKAVSRLPTTAVKHMARSAGSSRPKLWLWLHESLNSSTILPCRTSPTDQALRLPAVSSEHAQTVRWKLLRTRRVFKRRNVPSGVHGPVLGCVLRTNLVDSKMCFQTVWLGTSCMEAWSIQVAVCYCVRAQPSLAIFRRRIATRKHFERSQVRAIMSWEARWGWSDVLLLWRTSWLHCIEIVCRLELEA